MGQIIIVVFGVALFAQLEEEGVTFEQIMEEAEQQAEEAEGR